MTTEHRTEARLDGLKFHGTRPVEGLAIVRFEGWNEPPSARGDQRERPAAHGDFDLPVYRGARLITMSGWARARSVEDLGDLGHRFSGLLADGSSGLFSVTEYGLTLRASVRIYGQPTFVRRDLFADWSLKLRAVNPRKYGATRTFAAGVNAHHDGNFPATPRLLIGAGTGGYTVTGPGDRQITVNANAPTAAHYIDFSTGGLFTAAGGRVANTVTVWQPWEIPPGVPAAAATITGGRSLIQRVTDTYI